MPTLPLSKINVAHRRIFLKLTALKRREFQIPKARSAAQVLTSTRWPPANLRINGAKNDGLGAISWEKGLKMGRSVY
jgi:hypothetical protein